MKKTWEINLWATILNLQGKYRQTKGIHTNWFFSVLFTGIGIGTEWYTRRFVNYFNTSISAGSVVNGCWCRWATRTMTWGWCRGGWTGYVRYISVLRRSSGGRCGTSIQRRAARYMMWGRCWRGRTGHVRRRTILRWIDGGRWCTIRYCRLFW